VRARNMQMKVLQYRKPFHIWVWIWSERRRLLDIYEYMVIQMEDYAYFLRVLYPHLKFVFMLDYSCRHDKQKKDGLNAANIGKSFRGTQANLWDTHIKEEKGYLRPFPSILKVRVVQMTFTPIDDGFFGRIQTQGK
jgi:hypothetical protein